MKNYGEKTGINTKLLHAVRSDDKHGATGVPIYQTSAFAHQTAEELEAIFAGNMPGFAYSRIGNPTVENFERRMASLEGGISATACSSGSAAVACTLLTILKSGDEIIVPTGLYGGTLDLFRDLEPFGIRAVFLDDFTADNVEAAITTATKAVFAELIGNPKLNVVDLVVHPASTIFLHSSEPEREAAGVYDDLIRISVGIGDIDDIIADFDRALSAANKL